MDIDNAADNLYDSFLKSVQEENSGRCFEVNLDCRGKSITQTHEQQVSKEKFMKMEYLNTVRDAKLRLEAQVLRFEVQVALQKLSTKEFECLEAELKRVLATEVADYQGLVREADLRLRHQLKMANRKESEIEVRLALCQQILDKTKVCSACPIDGPGSRDPTDAVREVIASVKLSSDALTRLIKREGYQTPESMSAATVVIVAEAAGVERELRELRKQIDAIEARLKIN